MSGPLSEGAVELQRLRAPLCEVESDAQEQLIVERSSAEIYPKIAGTERSSIQEEHEDGQAGEGTRAVHEGRLAGRAADRGRVRARLFEGDASEGPGVHREKVGMG